MCGYRWLFSKPGESEQASVKGAAYRRHNFAGMSMWYPFSADPIATDLMLTSFALVLLVLAGIGAAFEES